MHKIRLSNESINFFVFKNNIFKWKNKLTINVKFKKLKIRLIVVHEFLSNSILIYTSNLIDLIKTKKNASFDSSKKNECTSIALMIKNSSKTNSYSFLAHDIHSNFEWRKNLSKNTNTKLIRRKKRQHTRNRVIDWHWNWWLLMKCI